ncbi:Hypothetical protein A7982_02979 [Minicystis rosea]|nr:Hypothetical protein A7982_02979 [Minicystis rosea]
MPAVVDILRGALAFRDASLVIFRHKLLVEMKTEKLGPGLSLYEEDGYTSWQIGAFEDHHCHLDIGACTGVLFGAEPVSCQGGRLNYTVWFLVEGDCGNPYRPDAYFSVTLNKPYTADGEVRRELVQQVLDLYRRFEDVPGVSAEPTFIEVLTNPKLGFATAAE